MTFAHGDNKTDETELRPEVAKRLLKQMQEAREGKNMSPAFKNVDDAIAWLKK